MGLLRNKKKTDTIEVVADRTEARPPSWPSAPPAAYLGQLRDSFQQVLANRRADLSEADCTFYHSVDLPDRRTIAGPWDLRGREKAYLGNVDVKGKRVLEMGPSTGHLSFWMEKQGAKVVAFDVGFNAQLDVQPGPVDEMPELHTDHLKMIDRFQNSWWYLHNAYQSKSKMVYGDIYSMPGDLGSFEIATFGSILLHLRSPISALEQAARRTTEKIVVTDTWPEGEATMMDNIMRPFPNGENGRWLLWWLVSAGAVVEMLKILGFDKTTVTTHTQLHQHEHKSDVAYVEQPMYTVVGERTKRSFAY